jgi:murein DD-endopeptidase MepM/ murein hydrolase activator NlpD
LIIFMLALGILLRPPPLSVTLSPGPARPGDVILLTVTGAAPAAPIVHVFDRTWPVYASGPGQWRALVGIDLDTRTGRHEIAVTSGEARVTRPLVVRSRTFPTRRLSVDPALVNPPPEARERIDRESRELAAAFTASPPERSWTTAFVRPVPDVANSAFGTHSVFNGQPTSQHTGADFLSPSGRPVKAPNAGRVVIAGARYFSGNTVVIDHGQGLFSVLAHLSQIDVAVGDTVAAGRVIGTVGSTGRVTGPHLHWAVRLNGARVDPLSLLNVAGTVTAASAR